MLYITVPITSTNSDNCVPDVYFCSKIICGDDPIHIYNTRSVNFLQQPIVPGQLGEFFWASAGAGLMKTQM